MIGTLIGIILVALIAMYIIAMLLGVAGIHVPMTLGR